MLRGVITTTLAPRRQSSGKSTRMTRPGNSAKRRWDIHLLGYFLQEQPTPAFRTWLFDLLASRRARNVKLIENVFSTEQKQDYLKAAACMRAHGIPGFPDPVISGTQVQFPIPAGVDPNSAQFTQARQICSRIIPAGLPYSGNSR